MVDRTKDYNDAVMRCAAAQKLTEAELQRLRKAQILRSLAAESEFTRAAADVARNLVTLANYIKSIRHDYVQPGRLTEAERDQIEQEVANSVRICSSNIERLEKSITMAQQLAPDVMNESTVAFRHGVALTLSERLKNATSAFDKCRGLRYKQEMQRRKLAKSQETSAFRPYSNGFASPADGGQSGLGGMQQQAMMEQQAMGQDLLETHEQVARVEKTMLEVATLNQIFATQVLHQSQQIEEIYMQAVRATDNLQAGNKNLTKAIRLNTSARLYVLLILMTASFGLLFLDWYAS